MSDSVVSIKWSIRSKYSTKSLQDMIETGVFSYTGAISDRTGDILDGMLNEITEWMRANAPWQDQTGRARAALVARRTRYVGSYMEKFDQYIGKDLGITIGYMNAADPVFYAWYLETKNSGKYQIVLPTLDRFGAEVFERVRTRLGLR